MAVALAVLVFKGGGHERTVIMDAVIHREGRHHPFAAGKSVGGSSMCIVQRKRTAERVGDCLQHVRPADGGAGHFQLAFLLGFHNVEIAVTVHVLQGIRGAADAVTGGCSRSGHNLNRSKRYGNGNVDGIGRIDGFRCRSRFLQ